MIYSHILTYAYTPTENKSRIYMREKTHGMSVWIWLTLLNLIITTSIPSVIIPFFIAIENPTGILHFLCGFLCNGHPGCCVQCSSKHGCIGSPGVCWVHVHLSGFTASHSSLENTPNAEAHRYAILRKSCFSTTDCVRKIWKMRSQVLRNRYKFFKSYTFVLRQSGSHD